MPPITPGPAIQPVLQRAGPRVPARAARRPDLPLPRHHRRRDRRRLQEHHRLARPDLLRARHHQCRPVPVLRRRPALQRRDQAPQRNRDHDPGPEDPPHQRKHRQNGRRQGKKTQRLLVMKSDLGNPSSSREPRLPHRKPGTIPADQQISPTLTTNGSCPASLRPKARGIDSRPGR